MRPGRPLIAIVLAFPAAALAQELIAGEDETLEAPPPVDFAPQPQPQGERFTPATVSTVDEVDPTTGSFRTAVPIRTPPFRGLEPSLALRYDSSAAGREGFAGAGWRLAGFGAIERGSRVGGVPRYDASDIFLFDGQELVPCTALGGTHCTRVQSYQRIRRTGDRWEVWQKDGRKATYEPVLRVADQTFRWGLTRLEDPRGNAITYSWWCDGNPGYDCYPEKVSYNGNTVTIVREPRSDWSTFATGLGIGWNRFRIQKITVDALGARAHTYELSYDDSPGNGRSRLTRVLERGRDGTAMPEVGYGYQAPPPSPFAGPVKYSKTFTPAAAALTWYAVERGDYDGDGRSDFRLHFRGGTRIHSYVFRSLGNGAFADPVYFTDTVTGAPAGLEYFGIEPGDYNGDGRTDFRVHLRGPDTIVSYVWLSLGDGRFDGPHAFSYTGAAAVYGFNYYGLESGDYDGDGRTDFRLFLHLMEPCCTTRSTVHSYVFLSTGGGGFWGPAYWSQEIEAPPFAGIPGWRYDSVDLNGDGRADLLFHLRVKNATSNFSGLFTYSALGRGDGSFAPFVAWSHTMTPATSALPAYEAEPGDFNGDGATDLRLHFRTPGALHSYVYLSVGNGAFSAPLYWTHAANAGFDGYAVDPADLNHDGKTDFLLHRRGNDQISLAAVLSRGDGGFTAPRWFSATVSSPPAGLEWFMPETGDYDGDGHGDLRLHFRTADTITSVVVTGARAPEGLLTQVQNGMGASTTVAYSPATEWPDGLNAPPVATVRSRSIFDGGSTATTSFAYWGARGDRFDRRFLGFRVVRETLPCIAGESACPYVDRWFLQGRATAGLLDVQIQRAGAADVAAEYHDYTVDESALPFQVLRSGTWMVAPGQPDKTAYVAFAHDTYGNVTRETWAGDTQASGDEKTVIFGYENDTSRYIVGLIKDEEVRGPNGQRLSATTRDLDRGLVTRESRWLDSESRWIETHRSYYPDGALETVVDERAGTTTTTWDPTRTFVATIANPLGHTTSTTWDTTCAQPLTVTDPDAQVSTYAYDGLCRRIRAVGPGDTAAAPTMWTEYPDFHTTITHTRDGSADGLREWAYVDGLGRPAERCVEVDPATTGQSWSCTGTAYDARGNVWREYPPHPSGARDRFVERWYDVLGRPVREKAPGVAETRTSYQGWTSAARNPRGYTTTTTLDAYGQTARIDRAGIVTVTRHDVLGRLRSVVDDAGNETTADWDSLGRRTTLVDPDLGTWSYGYDDAGNPVAQTDPRGVTIRRQFDALNRLVLEDLPPAGPGEEDVTNSYDGEVPATCASCDDHDVKTADSCNTALLTCSHSPPSACIAQCAPGNMAIAGCDCDGDGLATEAEAALGTDPARSDSDGDGLGDGVEVAMETDPRNPDSDGDGVPDGLDPTPLGLIFRGSLRVAAGEGTTVWRESVRIRAGHGSYGVSGNVRIGH